MVARSLGVVMALTAAACTAAPRDHVELAAAPNDRADAGFHLDWAPPALDLGQPPLLVFVCDETSPRVCPGGCANEMGCCVTGARPTGTCTTAADSSWRCALDCQDLARRYGWHVYAQCEALCTFVEIGG